MTYRQALGRAAQHIRDHLPLSPVLGIPGLQLHRPTPRSQLSQLASILDTSDGPPYWAYAWAGGLALAKHLRAHPDIVAGQRVLDLGAGSGLVGIVAAQLGASSVVASDIDVLARVVIPLNAAANGVSIRATARDFLADPLVPPKHGCNVVLAGDFFYDEQLASRALTTLVIAAKAGCTVLIGDPGRKTLPLDRLEKVATYPVTDMGLSPNGPPVEGMVFAPRPSWR